MSSAGRNTQGQSTYSMGQPVASTRQEATQHLPTPGKGQQGISPKRYAIGGTILGSYRYTISICCLFCTP